MKNVKVLCQLVLAILTYQTATGQLTTHVDKITGDTTIMSEVSALYRMPGFGTAGEKLEYNIAKMKETYLFSLRGRTGSSDIIVIDPDGTSILKLENSDTIQIHVGKRVVSDYNYSLKMGTWTAIYPIPFASVQKLSSSNIKYIRLSHSNGITDYEIKPKLASKLTKDAGLIIALPN